MPYENRQCKSCGITFEPYQYNQVRCGKCVTLQGKKYIGEPPKQQCPVCSTEFIRRTPRQTYCSKECGGTQRTGYIKQTYGISQREYMTMLRNQNEKCAICGKEETAVMNGKRIYLAVDHCHSKGHIRGLLCRQCNVGLGNFQDNLTYLRNAIKYLEGSETIPSGSTLQAMAVEAHNTEM